jgi:hypothetical protein
MNFLQRIISKKVLKGMEKMAQKDPVINKSFNDLAKASYQLQKDIDAHIKKGKSDGTFK